MSFKLKNRLAECRDAKGIKKSQLAYYLRMSRGYVTRLERGDIRPSAEAMLRIARYFRKPVEEVFQLVEETSGKAAFHPISRRASVRAGESTITAED
jgi:putative transcriptional regulator